MKLQKRNGKYWIVGVEPYSVDGVSYTDYGPYHDRTEAQSDLEGLGRFLAMNPPDDAVESLRHRNELIRQQRSRKC